MNPDFKARSVSQTTLNLLRECDRCFWLHTKCVLPRPRAPWPSALRKMDQSVNEYWRAYAKRSLLPPHLEGLVEGVPITPSLEAWFDRATGLYLVGRLDSCIRTAQWSFVPVDHKWKGTSPVIIDQAYLLQLDAYDLLLEKNGYLSAGFGLLDYFIPSGEAVDGALKVSTQVVRVVTDRERALQQMVRAREVMDLDAPPDLNLDCDFCMWLQATQSLSG